MNIYSESECIMQPVNILVMLCPPLTFSLYEITFFLKCGIRMTCRLHIPLLSVCKEAKADLVFLVDGSWSIGDDNFMKITRFLYSTMGSLDLIGPDGTQVSHSHSGT